MASMVVHIKDGEEKAHHYVADHALKTHIKFYTEYGYICEQLSLSEYEEKYGVKGEPLVSKPKEKK